MSVKISITVTETDDVFIATTKLPGTPPIGYGASQAEAVGDLMMALAATDDTSVNGLYVYSGKWPHFSIKTK